MEATGKFHRAAHRSLHADGFAVAVVNPLRSRLFAEALGALAKTDRVDCRMLAILCESLKPDAAVAARTALLNQLGATTARPAAVEIRRQLRAAETAIENLEAEIEALIGADPRLARRLAILTSIPGVGTVTAIALLVGPAEIGSFAFYDRLLATGKKPKVALAAVHAKARHSWITARLGGWNGYYKPPGPKTMADGWRRLAAMLDGYAIAHSKSLV